MIMTAVRFRDGTKQLVKAGQVTTAEEARQAVFAGMPRVRTVLALVPAIPIEIDDNDLEDVPA